MGKKKNVKVDIAELSGREKKIVEKYVPTMGQYRSSQTLPRRREVRRLFDVLVMHSQGVEPTIPQDQILDLGCRLAESYFSEAWWRGNADDELMLSRENKNPELVWLEVFRLSLLFAGLAENRELLKLLGQWPEAWMRPELATNPFPIGIEQVYFAILHRFGISEVPADSSLISDQRMGMLFEGLAGQSDSELSESCNRSLDIFEKCRDSLGEGAFSAVAIEESVIVHVARVMAGVDLLADIDSSQAPLILTLRS